MVETLFLLRLLAGVILINLYVCTARFSDGMGGGGIPLSPEGAHLLPQRSPSTTAVPGCTTGSACCFDPLGSI